MRRSAAVAAKGLPISRPLIRPFSHLSRAPLVYNTFQLSIASEIPRSVFPREPHAPLAASRRDARLLHASRAAAAGRDFKLTDVGEGIVEVTIRKWFVKPGDEVKEYDLLCEVESDKAALEITSRFDGVVKRLGAAAGQLCRVGDTLVEFEPSEAGAQSDSSSVVEKKVAKSEPVANILVAPATPSSGLATPAVRHLAKQANLSIDSIHGTGKDGRVTKEDVLNVINAGKASSTPPPAAALEPAPTTELVRARAPDAAAAPLTVPIEGIRLQMHKAMTASLRIPHLGLMEEVNLEQAYAVIAKSKVSILGLLIKMTSVALSRHPQLNAHVADDEHAASIRVFPRHDIGIAVDTPRGLVVPVIRSCETKSALTISEELLTIKALAKDAKFGREYFAPGPTFTLSNVGSLGGGTYASPVLAPPQIAMGAFGRARRVPVYESEESNVLVPARVLFVSWSADHRVVDGAAIARFSNEFRALVENPGRAALTML